MKEQGNDIVVEFRLHADLTKFELIAKPVQGQLNATDIINALKFAIEHVESQDSIQDFEPNSTH